MAGRTWRNLLGNEVGDAVHVMAGSAWQCPVGDWKGRSGARVALGRMNFSSLLALQGGQRGQGGRHFNGRSMEIADYTIILTFDLLGLILYISVVVAKMLITYIYHIAYHYLM